MRRPSANHRQRADESRSCAADADARRAAGRSRRSAPGTTRPARRNRAERTPGSPSSASMTRPESSATVRRALRRSRPARHGRVCIVVERLEARVFRESRAGFLGLLDRREVRQARAGSQAGPPAARESREACRIGGGDQRRRIKRTLSSLPQILPDEAALQRNQLADPGVGEIEQPVERLASERQRFGRALQLDVQPAPVLTMFMSTSARESSTYARSSIGSPSTIPTLVAAT